MACSWAGWLFILTCCQLNVGRGDGERKRHTAGLATFLINFLFLDLILKRVASSSSVRAQTETSFFFPHEPWSFPLLRLSDLAKPPSFCLLHFRRSQPRFTRSDRGVKKSQLGSSEEPLSSDTFFLWARARWRQHSRILPPDPQWPAPRGAPFQAASCVLR